MLHLRLVMRRLPWLAVLGWTFASAGAWVCAVWVPTRTDVPPVLDEWFGWQHTYGIGYSEMSVLTARGFETGPMEWRARGESSAEVGLPFPMYQSRVVPQSSRSGLELPLAELFRRGFPTDRLPQWLGAQSNRRIAIQPVWPGMVANVVIWGVAIYAFSFAMRSATQVARKRLDCRDDVPMQATM